MSVGVQRLREEPDRIRQGAIDKREDPALVDRAIEVDARRRRLQAESDSLKAERNAASQADRRGDPRRRAARTAPRSRSCAPRPRAAGARIDEIDAELAAAEAELEDLLLRIPNPADPEVPVGGEEANVTVRTWGENAAREVTAADGTTWERRPHWEIGEALDIIDNPRGAKIAGSGFPVYKGAGSRLQRSLISLVPRRPHRRARLHRGLAAGRRQRGVRARAPARSRTRKTRCTSSRATTCTWSPRPRSRSPTSTATRSSRPTELPIRYAAYSPCFRREAGAAGKDTRGILRVHQFDKVEMVLFEKPEDSPEALEWMTARAEVLLQRLGLPYRVLLMSTGEMGFVQRKKYDLEVWAPGVERWLEVSSCSNFGDYQARRMAIRYRPENRAPSRSSCTRSTAPAWRCRASWRRSSSSTRTPTAR